MVVLVCFIGIVILVVNRRQKETVSPSPGETQSQGGRHVEAQRNGGQKGGESPDTENAAAESKTIVPGPAAPFKIEGNEIPGAARHINPYPLITEAPDFPYNLKTFEDWGSLSAEDLKKYRASLISRVGHWDSAAVGEFFFSHHDSLATEEAKREFRESILGVWCAKDVKGCLKSIEETFSGDLAFTIKRDALTGWAAEDWMTALSYFKTHGEESVSERLGGDSSGFVANIVGWMAIEAPENEAEELISLLEISNNRQAAQTAYRQSRLR